MGNAFQAYVEVFDKWQENSRLFVYGYRFLLVTGALLDIFVEGIIDPPQNVFRIGAQGD